MPDSLLVFLCIALATMSACFVALARFISGRAFEEREQRRLSVQYKIDMEVEDGPPQVFPGKYPSRRTA